jgi:hypothetical protein
MLQNVKLITPVMQQAAFSKSSAKENTRLAKML